MKKKRGGGKRLVRSFVRSLPRLKRKVKERKEKKKKFNQIN